jgi:hypothetical protein
MREADCRARLSPYGFRGLLVETELQAPGAFRLTVARQTTKCSYSKHVRWEVDLHIELADGLGAKLLY